MDTCFNNFIAHPRTGRFSLQNNNSDNGNPATELIILRKYSILFLQLQLNVDIHDPEERVLEVQMPTWYSYTKEVLLNETPLGSTTYQINVVGMSII